MHNHAGRMISRSQSATTKTAWAIFVTAMFTIAGCDENSGATDGPDAPKDVVATAADKEIQLSWSQSAHATSYTIYWSQTSGVGPDNGNSLTDVTSPYVHRPLVNNQMYFYVIVASNAKGDSMPSPEVGATPQPAPGAPLMARADAGDGEVTITWSPSTGTSTYSIYWSVDPGVSKDDGVIADLPAAENSYIHTGLENEKTYYYAIAAKNRFGESPLSPEVSATPFPSTAIPYTPTNVVTTAGDEAVTLSWTATPGAATYNVYWAITSGAGTLGTKVEAAASNQPITGLTNGVTYYFVVTAENGNGESAPSNEVSATPVTSAVIPDPPQNVVATAGDASVTLTWDAVDNADLYNVYHSVTAGLGAAGILVAHQSSGDTVTGLVNGAVHYFVVTAVNEAGESIPSNESSATPEATPQPPAPPSAVSAVGADSQITVTWTPATGATSHNLYYSETSGTGTAGTLVEAVTPPQAVMGLTNGTTYFVIVTAINDVGESSPSQEVSATPILPTEVPAAPTGLIAEPGVGVVQLTWALSATATSYTIYFAESSPATAGTSIAGAQPGAVVAGLTNDTTYYFAVTAHNAVGESPASDEISATPQEPETWTLSVNNTPPVEHREIADPSAPDGSDPVFCAEYDLTASWGRAPQPTTVVRLNLGYANETWEESLEIEFYSDQVGTYSIADEDARARYQSGANRFENDNGTFTSGIIDVDRHDDVGGKIGATFDLTLCRVENCAASAVHLTGSFLVTREPDTGTVAHPKVVGLGVGHTARVDNTVLASTSSYFEITPVVAGTDYSIFLWNLSDDVDLQIFTDATFTTPYLCPASSVGIEAEQCVVAATGDSLFLRIDYAAVGPGADFAISATELATLPTPTGLYAVAGDSAVYLRWSAIPNAQHTVYWGTSPGDLTHLVRSVVSPWRHQPANNDTTYYYAIAATLPDVGEGTRSAEVSATPTTPEPPVVFADWPAASLKDAMAAGCGTPGALTRTIEIVQSSFLIDVNVFVNVTHPFVRDVDLFLEYNNGEQTVCVELSTGNGEDGHNYVNTVFDDEADAAIDMASAPFSGAFWPESPLSQLYGLPMTATWTLYASDSYAGSDNGTLNSWSLEFVYSGAPPPPPAAPPGLEAVPGDERLFLNWTRVPEAVSYILRWGTESGSTPNEIANVAAPFVHGGLTNDVTYYYVVAGVNAGGVGENSDEVAGTPREATEGIFSDEVELPVPTDTGNAGCGADTELVRTITTERDDYIHDVDVGLDVTHTYTGDLDIFLEFDNHGDPICVELTTDNGGGGDNFRNTVFDDDATVAITSGTPPFSGSYRPEGVLGDFNNVPMGGTWKLYIRDDAGGDNGTIHSWYLYLHWGDPLPPPAPTGLTASGGVGQATISWTDDTRAESYNLYWSTVSGVGTSGTRLEGVTSPYVHSGLTHGETYYYVLTAINFGGESEPTDEVSATPIVLASFSDSPSVAIPDAGGYATTCGAYQNGIASTIVVTQADAIRDVDVELNITHPVVSDLDIFLELDDGSLTTCVQLSTDNGSTNLVQTVLDDEAVSSIITCTSGCTGNFRPEGSLSDFDRAPMAGTWTLHVSDDSSANVGTLNSWTLILAY